MNWALIITCIILLAIAYTDFKERAVPVYLFIGLLVICFITTVLQTDMATAFLQLAINTGLIMLLLVALLIYYRLRQSSLKEVINQKLGIGDMAFWIAIAPLFSVVNFMLFFISSLLVVLLIMIVRIALKKRVALIPLAGYQAAVLVVIIIINRLFFNHPFSIDLLSFN
ncbi:prepilin peptidase [Niabella sp. 22666]|uniref:prepilin peptidase n=1 Tax=Niabella sp. 22666 TaxID=3453954 RepID=UPI003F853460